MSQELVIAFDFTDREVFFKWINQLKGYPVVIKIGQKSLPFLNLKEDLKIIKSHGFKVFLDLKLYDIPSQVSDAVNLWNQSKLVDFLTLHISGGQEMITKSTNIERDNLKLLGITSLTSFKNDQWQQVYNLKLEDSVESFINYAKTWHLDGIVCSAKDLLNNHSLGRSPNFLYCTPGVYINQPNSDQSRNISLDECLQSGSNLIVIGRSIINNPNPKKVIEDILQKLK